jgi:hypothetical protein
LRRRVRLYIVPSQIRESAGNAELLSGGVGPIIDVCMCAAYLGENMCNFELSVMALRGERASSLLARERYPLAKRSYPRDIVLLDTASLDGAAILA